MTATETLSPERERLPHSPEPVAHMLHRLQAALEPLINPDHLIENAPGFDRRHVFDFANGVRLIITREQDKRRMDVHLSFGVMEEFQKFWPSKSAFVAHAGMTANLLGFSTGGEETETLVTDRAVHIWIPITLRKEAA